MFQRQTEHGGEEKNSALLGVEPLSSDPCFKLPPFTHLSVCPYEHVGTRRALSAHALVGM